MKHYTYLTDYSKEILRAADYIREKDYNAKIVQE